MTKRALIIGGSVGGLFAANLLRDVGWDATVFERNPEELAGRGAGISTHPQLHDVTRRLGIPFDDSMGISVDKSCSSITTARSTTSATPCGVMSSWGAISARCATACRPRTIASACRSRASSRTPIGVTAIFADGTRERGDMLIGADGGRSTVREQFLPGEQPVYAGYVAWRAMLDERRDPAGHPFADLSPLHLLPAAGRIVPRLSGARPQQRDRARQARLQHRLVPADHAGAARRFLHRRNRQEPRHHHPAAADPARRHRLGQGSRRATWWRRRCPGFSRTIRGRSSSRSSTWTRRRSCSAAWRCSATPRSRCGRIRAPAPPRRRSTRPTWPTPSPTHGVEAGLQRYQRVQGAFGSGLVRQGRHDGSYITDQHKPREQRRNPDLTWGVDDLMRDHDGRSEVVRRLFDASRRRPTPAAA